MMNSIKAGSGVSDRTPDRRAPQEEPQPAHVHGAADEEQTPAAPGADLRLVIERDAHGADHVYRLIDHATGKVVAEYSREQVARLGQGPGYRAGAVVSTKA